MKIVVSIILSFIVVGGAFAQLTIRPIPKKLTEARFDKNRLYKKQAITDTVTLPFWDDFSYDGQDPDTTYWLYGNDVLINSGEGINAPTLNVATFDGLNAAGRPHSDSEFVAEADSLVSRPIDLSLVPDIKRPTVYLSFFWQKQGLGELPDEKDSIRLQFFRSDSTWVTKRRISGLESNLSRTSFTQEFILVDDAAFFHKGFKFKFQSFGKTTGPFDAWHLDYIYLNQDRTNNNESIFDHAISAEPVSIFDTYTNIPYDQLFALPNSTFIPYKLGLASLERRRQSIQYDFIIRDSLTNQVLYTESGSGGGLNPDLLAAFEDTVKVAQFQTDTIRRSIFDPTLDSITIATEFQFISGDKLLVESIDNGGADTTFLVSDSLNYRVNDTLRRFHIIHETLSYDDGTADFAAGINQKNGQIAMEYTIATADTLTALDIYFPVIEPNASGQAITFSVLNDLSDSPGSIIIRQDELVRYSSKINEFVRYELNRPIIVNGTFYIVFEQVRDQFIGIGLDKNNPQPGKMFSNTFGTWEQNSAESVNGSLMFRAIFENTNAVITSTQTEYDVDPISVFPNPANDRIVVEGNFIEMELFTISGEKKHLRLDGKQMDVSALPNGIYVLRIKKLSGVVSKKIIVAH